MRAQTARVAAYLVGVVYLVTLAAATVLVWTSDERAWFVGRAETGATLGLNLTDWSRIAITVAIAALTLPAVLMLMWLPRLRAHSIREAATGDPSTHVAASTPDRVADESASVRAAEQPSDTAGYSSSVAHSYQSFVAGDATSQRSEQSVPFTIPTAVRHEQNRSHQRPVRAILHRL